MEQILKIVKIGGILLNNYVSMLVGVLLNALDELESGGTANYLQLQADKYNNYFLSCFFYIPNSICTTIKL